MYVVWISIYACSCAVYAILVCACVCECAMYACLCGLHMSVYGCAHDKVSKSYRTKYTIANNCMIQWQHIDCTCMNCSQIKNNITKCLPWKLKMPYTPICYEFISCTYAIVIVISLPKEVVPFLLVHIYMTAPHSIEVEAGEWNLCYCSIMVVSLLLK